jgi:hypothetical protein
MTPVNYKFFIYNNVHYLDKTVWYGHLQRMDEERLPQTILNWIPIGRRKRGKPKTRRKESILRAMEECGLRDGDCKSRLGGDQVLKGVAIHHRMTAYICKMCIMIMITT